MEYFFLIVIIILLNLIALEDIIKRTLDIRIGILLFFVTSGYYFTAEGFKVQFLYNIALLVIMMGLLSGYFMFRDRKLHNSLVNRFGMGDFFFLFAVSPLFDIKKYLLFIISGMVVALLFHYISLSFTKNSRTDIPLAGYLSIYLIIIILLDVSFNSVVLNFVA